MPATSGFVAKVLSSASVAGSPFGTEAQPADVKTTSVMTAKDLLICAAAMFERVSQLAI
jgi:hypothetical protein